MGKTDPGVPSVLVQAQKKLSEDWNQILENIVTMIKDKKSPEEIEDAVAKAVRQSIESELKYLDRHVIASPHST